MPGKVKSIAIATCCCQKQMESESQLFSRVRQGEEVAGFGKDEH